MTISAPELKIKKFAGDGVSTSFTFTFRVTSADEVVVYYSDRNGVERRLQQSEYVLVLSSSGLTGVVQLRQPLMVGEVLVITRETPRTQELDLINQGEFFAEDVETAFDKLTSITQEITEKLSRTIEVPITSDKTAAEIFHDISLAKVEAEKLLQSQTAIDTLALHVPAIETVSDNIDGVQTVASNIGSVNTVAKNIGSVNTVAPGVPAIIKLADNWNQVVPVVDVANQVAQNAKTATEKAAAAASSADDAERIRTQYLEWSKYLTIQNGMVCVTFQE